MNLSEASARLLGFSSEERVEVPPLTPTVYKPLVSTVTKASSPLKSLLRGFSWHTAPLQFEFSDCGLGEGFLWGRKLRESRELPQHGHQLGTRT